ncbi:MAG TPA: flagellar basal body-associated FliL family protein [Bdellovibrio sp.]|uniref:flagellar basal body-associated FliL family protein n=1 Tax=Bdellovibrio sp. TaxID=28201 RepID=UPI002EE8DB05
MAENESSTKVEEPKKEGAENASGENSEEVLSLDNLDSIIAEEDPEFAAGLQEITPQNIGHLDSDSDLEIEYTLDYEKRQWVGMPGPRGKLVKAFPFLPYLSYKIKMKRTSMRLTWIRWKEQLIHGLRNLGPSILKWLKAQLGAMKSGMGEGMTAFKSFSLVKKLAFVGLLVVTVGAGFVFYKIATNKLIPAEQDLFLPSLDEWAQAKYQYGPEDQKESFYDSTRTAQNIMELQKMIVNIRRSASSGPNPMAAMEFYVEGTVAEVVVEIKDRESEVQDLFQRTIEDTNYDQLSSGEGKQMLCDRLRKNINKILTKGKVRRVFIKNAVIKP